MKKFLVIAVVVLVFVIVGIGITFATNNNKEDSTNNTQTQEPAKSEFEQIKGDMSKGAVLIDVRTPEEFTLEHAQGSINLPLGDIQNGITPNVPKNTKIYLYCRSGRRATEAKTILEQAGFTNVINIISLDKWKNMGGDTVKAS